MSYDFGKFAALTRLGLEKLAFGTADMQKMWQAVKPYMMPKAFSRLLPQHAQNGAFTIPTQDAAKKAVKVLPPDLMPKAGPEFQGLGRAAEQAGKPLIYVNEPEKALKSIYPHQPRLDGANKRALNAIVGGHEFDEMQSLSTPSTVTAGTGHVHPQVIFRENNRVATLPKEYSDAGELMRRAREFHENRSMFQPLGLEYGMQRYSRHAIKRLTEALERRNVQMSSGNVFGSMLRHQDQYGPNAGQFAPVRIKKLPKAPRVVSDQLLTPTESASRFGSGSPKPLANRRWNDTRKTDPEQLELLRERIQSKRDFRRQSRALGKNINWVDDMLKSSPTTPGAQGPNPTGWDSL